MLLENQKFAVVDIETTGTNIKEGASIIQIGAVIVQNDKIIQQSRLILSGKVRWRIFITVFYNIVMNMRFLLAGNYL